MFRHTAFSRGESEGSSKKQTKSWWEQTGGQTLKQP